MADSFYVAGAGRALRVNQLFDQIARRYDLVNDLQSLGLHRVWKRRVVEMVIARRGEQVLDLCCGTGDVTFGLADRGAASWGVDFSLPMLHEAVKKQHRRDASFPGVVFLCGDARRLPFADCSFDAVTISYGLRNLPSVAEGLAEMYRVIRPGGSLVVLEFGRPTNPVWRWIYLSYLKFWVPLLGWLSCGNSRAYSYILESLLQYPAQDGVTAELCASGYAQVRVRNFLGGVMSIHQAVKPECAGSGRERSRPAIEPAALELYNSVPPG
jgi:demethylmenaquinone methyltransferase/2-methoxy-6-polyprenyl-1,4-benzoquinol methylase